MALPRIKFCPGPAGCLSHYGTDLKSIWVCQLILGSDFVLNVSSWRMPVPEKMRLVGIQIDILDGQSLFSNDSAVWKETCDVPVMTIEDFILHSDDHFESHLLGNDCRILGRSYQIA